MFEFKIMIFHRNILGGCFQTCFWRKWEFFKHFDKLCHFIILSTCKCTKAFQQFLHWHNKLECLFQASKFSKVCYNIEEHTCKKVKHPLILSSYQHFWWSEHICNGKRHQYFEKKAKQANIMDICSKFSSVQYIKRIRIQLLWVWR